MDRRAGCGRGLAWTTFFPGRPACRGFVSRLQDWRKQTLQAVFWDRADRSATPCLQGPGQGTRLLAPPLGTHSGCGHWCWLQRRRMGLGLFLWSHRCRCTMWWSRRRRQPYLVNWIPVERMGCCGPGPAGPSLPCPGPGERHTLEKLEGQSHPALCLCTPSCPSHFLRETSLIRCVLGTMWVGTWLWMAASLAPQPTPKGLAQTGFHTPEIKEKLRHELGTVIWRQCQSSGHSCSSPSGRPWAAPTKQLGPAGLVPPPQALVQGAQLLSAHS